MDKVDDILTFFGSFHVLIVHLPIGFVFVAILFEGLTLWPRYSSIRPLLPFIWLLSALTTVLAAALGLMLASGGGYDAEELSSHQWSGFVLCFLAIICYFYRAKIGIKGQTLGRYVYVLLLICTTAMLIRTGHAGGTLTHGADYLVEYAPPLFQQLAGYTPTEVRVRRHIISLDSADIFEDAVQPILDTRCISCHNRSKRKGELILTSYDEMLNGGESGAVLVFGDPAHSELFRRITLPEDDEDRMPGQGKPPLSDNQIAIIEWWIEKNAPRRATIASLSPDDDMTSLFQEFFGINDVPGPDVSPADPSLLRAIADKGYRINTLSTAGNLLEATFRNENDFEPDVAILSGIKDQLVWLDLGESGISDEDLKSIGLLENLTKLDLHGNRISDSGVKHLTALQNLESLNLYGTNVTDDCLKSLASFQRLKRVYLWKTAVRSDALFDTLKSKGPG